MLLRGKTLLLVMFRFLTLGQDRNGSIHSYVSRLWGAAVSCNFEKKCSCGLSVSYMENIIHDQMVWGLVEQVVQEKVLSQVVEGDSLKKTMAYIDTLEKAKRDTLTLAGPGGLNRQGAWPTKSDGKGADKGGGQSKVVCWGCGAKGHHKWTSSCPTRNKECPGCKKERSLQGPV